MDASFICPGNLDTWEESFFCREECQDWFESWTLIICASFSSRGLDFFRACLEVFLMHDLLSAYLRQRDLSLMGFLGAELKSDNSWVLLSVRPGYPEELFEDWISTCPYAFFWSEGLIEGRIWEIEADTGHFFQNLGLWNFRVLSQWSRLAQKFCSASYRNWGLLFVRSCCWNQGPWEVRGVFATRTKGLEDLFGRSGP